MDEFARKEMIKDGFSSSSMVVTGQPHFETFKENIKRISSKEIREFKNKIGVGHDDLLVTFVSEPIIESYNRLYWGYDQLTILAYILKCINRISKIEKRRNFSLLIKLHPRSNRRIIDDFLKGCPAVGFKITVVADTSSALVISASDLVLGMSSMLLLESVLAKKSIISVQIGLKREDPFILSRIGYVKTVLSPRALQVELKRVIIDGANKKLRLPFSRHAADNVLGVIKKFL